jgi:hypothetical protein
LKFCPWASQLWYRATPERLSIAKKQMQGKDRDTIFSLPFIRGLYLHFLPDLEKIKPMSPPANFSYKVVEKDEGDVISSNITSQRVATG